MDNKTLFTMLQKFCLVF